MKWDGTKQRHLPFFSLKEETVLCDLGNLTLQKPAPQEEVEYADTEDEDSPF